MSILHESTFKKKSLSPHANSDYVIDYISIV